MIHNDSSVKAKTKWRSNPSALDLNVKSIGFMKGNSLVEIFLRENVNMTEYNIMSFQYLETNQLEKNKINLIIDV